MIVTSAAPPTDPPDHEGDGDHGAGGSGTGRRHARRPRRSTARIVLVVALVLALVTAGGGFAWYRASEYRDLAAQAAAAQQLLVTSQGKVADPAARDGLAADVERARDLLAEPVLARVTTGTTRTSDALAAASGAVHDSMLEHARGEVEAARASLSTVVELGEKVYGATEGLGADETVRAGLRSALDTASSLDGAGLADDDLAALEQALVDLGSALTAVDTTTDELFAAQDAVTCPAPDQVWDPDGGRVPEEDLAAIPWSPSDRVRADVLDSLVALDAAYVERFGVHLTINSAYRTYEEQAGLYDPSSPIAAPPGCSNHGLGLAVDLGGGVQVFDTVQYTWLKENAGTYGWTHPDFAEPDGRVPEPWHWESVLARQDP